jgi:hypothetical protein
MRRSIILTRGNAWTVLAAAAVCPLFAATASAQSFKISIGVRETGAAVPVGDNGTATGGIEWINLDGPTLNANNTWQQFTYTFGTDPVTAFAGATANGVLDGTRGTIEHIRILNSAGTTNPITIYMDDFVNRVSGVDTLISGFESTDPHPATLGALHMFNQPGFSGSTNGFLQNTPNTALVSDEQAHSGTQSNKVQFAFNTTSTTAWLRLTSFNAPGQPNPAIDFTAGNTVSFWLRGSVAVPSNFYQGPSGGNWNDPANWSTGDVPDTQLETANFLTTATPKTVNLDLPTLINGITFDSAAPNGYTINGTETLTLGGQIGFQRTLNVVNGTHTINTPLEIINSPSTPTSGWSINVTNAADVMNTNGPITLNNTGTMDINKNGPGTWNTAAFVATSDNTIAPVVLRINGGTVRLNSGGGLTKVHGIAIAGSPTPTAKLNITNNPVVVDYPTPVPPATSPLATIKGYIAAGYNGGGANAWTGQGITSTNANANQFAIGYGEASALSSVPAIFGTVDADSVLIRLTRYGDATLDGTVNLSDFNKLAGNFGQTGKFWTDGDFNYDGTVNLGDFNLLAGNFGLSAAGSEVTPQDWANLAAAVPEPTSLGLLGVVAIGSLRRRRHQA